ncbi:uncharacterized protein LOC126336821 isoform X2 [Schistocerca gregaria]|uniref:uncharacterized protein LOC126336821 isoform X2 n=1 Tax=Schistocerca gregaria TaxID=7010 RepID=UPI00211E6A65|nr:uncharacterized protein LOC126336821 isoform X2 [Schistocerca gregaria]
MDETQPGPSVWRPQPLPAEGWAAGLGFAQYVPQHRLPGQHSRGDAVRSRWARSHYLRLAWFIEVACRRLGEFREKVKKIAENLEKYHVDTTLKASRVDAVLRKKTTKYISSVLTIVSELEAAQAEIVYVLESGELDEVSEGEYERTGEVLVTLPRCPASLGCSRSVGRKTMWLLCGTWGQKHLSSETEASFLQTTSFDISDELQSDSEQEEEQPFANNAAGHHNSNGNAGATVVCGDTETMRDGDGLGKESSEITVDDEESDGSSLYSTVLKLCRLHAAVRRTLLFHTKNLRAKLKERGRMQEVLLGRRLTQLMVAHQMNAVCGVEGEVRDAVLQMAFHAEALQKFGAEVWPGEPSSEAASIRRSTIADLQQSRKQRSIVWRVCSLFCCVRRRC